jgi:hypothetical protein
MTAIWGVVSLVACGSALAAAADVPFPRIANCYFANLTPDSTPADVEEVARFDLLIGGVWANWGDPASVARLAERMAEARRLNPHILILDFSCSAPYADPADVTVPASAWLRQPDGTFINGWPGTRMLNLRRPEAVDWLVERTRQSLVGRGFDGVFIDCMGSGFDAWACNIDGGAPYQVDADGDGKADERAWLDGEWVAAKAELSRRVREAIGPDRVFMTNQAGVWGQAAMNGILLEDYLDYVMSGGLDFEQVMEEYLGWTRVAHGPNVTTIVSSSAIEPPFDPWRTMTQAAREALLEKGRSLVDRMRFGLTSTLMGNGYFAYDLHTRWRGQRWWYPEYDVPLGQPRPGFEQQGQRQADGTWRREFDGGTVIVNPTALDVLVSLPGQRRDVSTGRVAQDFVVPGLDGRVLVPTQDEPSPGEGPRPETALTVNGTARVAQRGDRVLCRLGGTAAALFDERGRMLELVHRGSVLARNAQAFMVVDDRWRDYAYQGCAHELRDDGSLAFTGKRVDGESEVGYTQTVTWGEGFLQMDYAWEALSAGHLHMCRQQVDFSVARYAGGEAQGPPTAPVRLPAERAPEPVLANGLARMIVEPEGGGGLEVQSDPPAALVDERHYGVNAYRLGSHPVSGDVQAGQRWTSRIRFQVR